ncbi:MAG TPA: DNA primase [Alloprevotella sp.]|nr:DNA primase [Alloprevotella sp.]
MIDSATISRVMEAADIVDVVKDFVTLRKAGVNYKGLCPFHNEKTPSFVVSPSKQLCKCFSCGKGGNAVHFIMEHEQMTYPEAIKWLGNKYGIEVQDKELTDEEKVAASARESLFVINEWARDYFINLLHNHVDGVAIGMAYFRNRGFRDDIIQKFQLGFALPSRDALAREAQQKGFNPELLLKTGLCFRTDDGRLLDRYHGRVIFPVHTISGKVVAFGGRILSSDKKLAKYVNSPESIIYSKSKELYGLYQAKHAIVKQNRCFLVEGYTDVISMHQSGIENVVASSGTSLTEGQIRLIHRFTNNITVLYDGDSAGIKASLRGIDMLLAEGMNIKVLLLPDGDDPDSFARKHNAAGFQEYLEQHQVDFIRFKTGLLLEDSGNDPIKRAGLIQDVVNSISVIPDRIIRQMYAKECASMLGISEQLVVSEIAKIKKEKAKSERTASAQKSEGTGENEEAGVTTPDPSPSSIGSQPATTRKEEELLVRIIVRFGEQVLFKAEDDSDIKVAAFIASDLEADGLEMHSPLFQRMLNEAASHCRNEDFHALNYFLAHPDAEISKTAAQLCEDRFQLSQRQQIGFTEDKDRLQELVPRLLHDFKNTEIKEEMKKLLMQLRSPEIMNDSEKCLAIMSRYKELCEIEKQFAQILGDRVIMP